MHFGYTCKKNWWNSCPREFNPVFYWRHINDIFVLFRSNDHLKYYQKFLNFYHINMFFSVETEKEKLSFLDIKDIREQGKFTTTIYRGAIF